ncbi:hypothetical protein M5D96_009179, partial [Drosophila gunungcola]
MLHRMSFFLSVGVLTAASPSGTTTFCTSPENCKKLQGKFGFGADSQPEVDE